MGNFQCCCSHCEHAVQFVQFKQSLSTQKQCYYSPLKVTISFFLSSVTEAVSGINLVLTLTILNVQKLTKKNHFLVKKNRGTYIMCWNCWKLEFEVLLPSKAELWTAGSRSDWKTECKIFFLTGNLNVCHIHHNALQLTQFTVSCYKTWLLLINVYH